MSGSLFIYVSTSPFLVYIIVFWSLDSLFPREAALRATPNARNIKESGDIKNQIILMAHVWMILINLRIGSEWFFTREVQRRSEFYCPQDSRFFGSISIADSISTIKPLGVSNLVIFCQPNYTYNNEGSRSLLSCQGESSLYAE